MSYATALTELNDSVDDYFGETVSYTPATGGAATTDITAVIDYTDVEGEAMLDLPIASVASPLVGSLITLDADSTTFRIYDFGNKRRGYTTCDIRSTDYWQSSTVQSLSGSTWSTFGSLTSFPVFIDQGNATEGFDGDTAGVEVIYQARCRYVGTITEKMRFAVGSVNYYITGIRPDASGARYLDLDLVKRTH